MVGLLSKMTIPVDRCPRSCPAECAPAGDEHPRVRSTYRTPSLSGNLQSGLQVGNKEGTFGRDGMAAFSLARSTFEPIRPSRFSQVPLPSSPSASFSQDTPVFSLFLLITTFSIFSKAFGLSRPRPGHSQTQILVFELPSRRKSEYHPPPHHRSQSATFPGLGILSRLRMAMQSSEECKWQLSLRTR